MGFGDSSRKNERSLVRNATATILTIQIQIPTQ